MFTYYNRRTNQFPSSFPLVPFIRISLKPEFANLLLLTTYYCYFAFCVVSCCCGLEGLLTHALARQRAIILMARTQVAFSKKSVVLRTPSIWLEPPKLEVRPPPFESCINITRISNMLPINISDSNNISPIILFVFFLMCGY